MRKIALAVPLILAGCVSTATFNKTVGDLEARRNAENAILRDKVRRLEDINDRVLSSHSMHTRILERLTSAAKFFFNKDRMVHSELIQMTLRQAQVEKNLSDLKKEVRKGKKKFAK